MSGTLTHVFTYGSLMYPTVWRRVVRGEYRSTPGTIRGYRRVRVPGQSYPALVPAPPHEAVSGVVYLAVSAPDLARLDHFEAEGELYRRVTVEVELEAGARLSAWAYLAVEPDRLEDQSWEPDRFEAEDLAQFLGTYCRARAPRG